MNAQPNALETEHTDGEVSLDAANAEKPLAPIVSIDSARATTNAEQKEKADKAATEVKTAVNPKPAVEPATKVIYPLAIEIDGKTFNTPKEASNHWDRLKGDAVEAFRQRYFGLLSEKAEAIDQSIDEAIPKIEKAERKFTKDNKIGITDILKPFVDAGIVMLEGNKYKPYSDIKKAALLANYANQKISDINIKIKNDAKEKEERKAKLEKDKKDFEERKTRRAAYEQVLKSDNGFEQTFKDKDGKEVAKFAFQIHLEQIKGITTTFIIVDKIIRKFGHISLQEKSYTLDGPPSETPPYLNAKARELLKRQANKQQNHPIGTIADVATAELGENGKESK